VPITVEPGVKKKVLRGIILHKRTSLDFFQDSRVEFICVFFIVSEDCWVASG
jgi:hypothetical protein